MNMRDIRTRIFLCFGIMLIACAARGQGTKLISGTFENLRFPQFVEEIEGITDVHFYYDPVELDTLLINIQANQLVLKELLKRVLSNTSFHFTIDSLNNIFVFNKRYNILAQLPDDFFRTGRTGTDSMARMLNESTAPSPDRALKSLVENKLFEIGGRRNNLQGKSILTGYVRDVKNGEPLTGASVYIDTLSIGTITDHFGYYSLALPKGRHVLHISSAGMKDSRRQIMLYSDGKLNIELQDDVPTLKAVVVISEKNSNIQRMQMGVERLNMRTIRKVPVLLGETDILRVVLTLPGVTSVGEASTGMNVRGGSADQNLG